jgi:ABC-type nickel/cobalt efflux system permease component RcnA
MSSNSNQHEHPHKGTNEDSLLGPGDFADKHSHSHENTNASNLQHSHRPYWKRAHRDWRIWVLVVLMIGCMGIYLMTGDLRWPFFGSRQAMVPIAN